MNTPFTIRQLEVFSRIAQGNSLTQTAESLGMSQSAASMSLSELEKALNGPLFHRISRKLVLNDRGRELMPQAIKILHVASKITDLLLPGKEMPQGNIIMGCSTTIASYWIPPLLKSFYSNHPKIEINLQAANTDAICKNLIDGKIDFALVEGEIAYDSLEEKLWEEDDLVIIAHPDHPSSKKNQVSLRDLVNEKWILREKGSGTRSTLEISLQKEGLELKNKTVIGHTESVKRAVENGLGISCLSRIAVKRELDLGFLSEIHTATRFTRWFRLVTVKGQYTSPLVRYVIETLHTLSNNQAPH